MFTFSALTLLVGRQEKHPAACPERCSSNCVAYAEMNSCKASTRETTPAAVEQHISYKIAVRLSRFGACLRRHISTTTSRHVNALDTLGHQRLQRCSSHSPGPTMPSTPSFVSSYLELATTVLDCVTLSTIKSKLKTFLFSHTFTYN